MLVLTCAPFVLDLDGFLLEDREEDFDDDSVVDRRFAFEGLVLDWRDDVEVRGVISW
jgi:hypothetical protein